MKRLAAGFVIFSVLIAFSILSVSGCKKKKKILYPPPGTGTGTGTVPAGLRPETDLTHNLCNFPAQDFSPVNRVSLGTTLKEGMYAIEFTLKDTSGVPHKLSELLMTRPVFMVFASET